MAHHSPSPSGSSSSRRLSELLGEQQEPFYLDLYLIEKGCSPAFLDAAACGGGAGACSTCWPRTRSTGGRLRRRPMRSKKAPRGSGVLRLLLPKILSGARAPTATTAKKTRLQPAAAIDWWRSVDDEKLRAPRDSEDASVPCPRAVESQHMEDVEEPEEEDDDEEDESSKKQLSPVSVLEQRLFEHSPPPHAQKAFVLFSELLEAAYAPTTLLSLLASARLYSGSVSKSKDARRVTEGGSTPPRRARKKNNSHARLSANKFDRDLARATALVTSEMASATEDVRPERRDIAADIAAAVLEALTEEAAAELLLLLLG